MVYKVVEKCKTLLFLLKGGNNREAILKLPFRKRVFVLLNEGVLKTFLLILNKTVDTVLGRNSFFISSVSEEMAYKKWLELNVPTKEELEKQRKEQHDFPMKPLISVLIPVYNPPLRFLKEAIESVKSQTYSNWQICISDDNSTDAEVINYLKELSLEEDIHVYFRKENGHISKNSNDALSLATGDFVALFDHDDLLTVDAFFEVVKVINENEEVDFIYTDEDKVDEKGVLSQPHFKPSFCINNLQTRNYITHLSVIRKSILNEIGGFREGYEGSQDFDLFLRVANRTNKIMHIPKILYHWRMHINSAAMSVNQKPYAYISGEKALEDYFKQKGEVAEVSMLRDMFGFYSVSHKIKKEYTVSILIPSKNQANVLRVCLESIFYKSTYKNFEIIILDNGSDERSFFDLIEEYKNRHPFNFKVLTCNYPFNFSKLINDGVKEATGEMLLLLNNDTEVITPDWIERMVKHSQRDSIGCVGVKLLYKNNTIQHAGVVMGIHGVASHAFLKLNQYDSGYYGFLKVVSDYSAVTGACMMVRKNLFNLVNGFEEALEVEYNDIDFCLKLKDLGYGNIYLPEVELYHYESLSRGNPLKNKATRERHFREIQYMKDKWMAYIEKDPCYSSNLALTNSNFQIRV